MLVKFNGTIAAENADVESGKVNVTVEGLPGDYQAEYTVEGLEDVQVKDGVLTYKTKGAEIGKYTLKYLINPENMRILRQILN